MNYFDKINFKYDKQADTLFIVDTNYLLYAYQSYSLSSKYVEALQSQNIYIPFVVFIEFINKIDEIKKRTSDALKNTSAQIDNINTEDIFIKKDIQMKIRSKLFNIQVLNGNNGIRFQEEVDKKINGLINNISNEINENINSINNSIKTNAEKFRLENSNRFDHKQYESNLNSLNHEFNSIFNKSLGQKYTSEEVSLFLEDMEERYENKIPPGFKDSNKVNKETNLPDMTFYGDIKFESKGGDLLLWKDLINHVNSTEKNFKHVVIVTDDSKEDWRQQDGSDEVNPLLKVEFLEKTDTPLDVISVQHFIDSSTIDEKYKTLIREELESKNQLENMKKLEDKNIVFTFKQEKYGVNTQAEMMKYIFERVINDDVTDINELLELSCLVIADKLKERNSSIFDRTYILNIDSDKPIMLGTRLNFLDKMSYIKTLFISADIDLEALSFDDPSLQDKWEKVM